MAPFPHCSSTDLHTVLASHVSVFPEQRSPASWSSAASPRLSPTILAKTQSNAVRREIIWTPPNTNEGVAVATGTVSSSSPLGCAPMLPLLHSQFRPNDREPACEQSYVSYFGPPRSL